MAFSPIQLTPNMDMATLVNAINDNFQQLASENRTKIIKDENGQSRILIGQAPKGNYIMAVTAPGKDVVQALEK